MRFQKYIMFWEEVMQSLIKMCKDGYPSKMALIVGEDEDKLQVLLQEMKNEQVVIIDIGEELSEYYVYQGLSYSGYTTETWINNRTLGIKQPIILVHTGILFSKSMKLDVIKMLKYISRSKIVIANIPGVVEENKLYIGNKYDADRAIYDVKGIPLKVII